MKVIKNDQDLRITYELLHILDDNAAQVDNPDKLTQYIIETKRAIRRYTNRETGYEGRIIKDYGVDGYLALERLPADIRDLTEAINFFERFMTYKCRPSAYDCTGQAMTNWFKVFPRSDGFYAYHSVGFDV